jgi:hemin uptake protein HemP
MKTTSHPRTVQATAPTGNDAPQSALTSTTGTIATIELLGSRRELIIEHAGFLYRLRITQNNKLILTK